VLLRSHYVWTVILVPDWSRVVQTNIIHRKTNTESKDASSGTAKAVRFATTWTGNKMQHIRDGKYRNIQVTQFDVERIQGGDRQKLREWLREKLSLLQKKNSFALPVPAFAGDIVATPSIQATGDAVHLPRAVHPKVKIRKRFVDR